MAGGKHSCASAKCRKIDDAQMVSCERCRRWWHYSCANFDPSAYDTATPWFCEESGCKEVIDEGAVGSAAVIVQDELEASMDVLIEAAVGAQASVSQKDLELAALRKELEAMKVKLANVSAPVREVEPGCSDSPSPSRPTVKLSSERLEMLRTIQANHQALLKGAQNVERDLPQKTVRDHLHSTPITGSSNQRVSFPETIQQADMSSLLTILNRGNVQELPMFSGANKREWPYFEEVFNATTIEGKFSSKENVARLRKALKGEAYQLVSDRLKYSSDDAAIMDSLRCIFGRSDVLVHGLTADLLKLPSLKSGCDSNLHLWAVRVNGFVADIRAMRKEEELFNGYVLTDLAGKLSAGLYQDWRKRESSTRRASLKDFADFLMEKVIDLPPELVQPREITTSKKASTSKATRQVFTHQPVVDSSSSEPCVNCSGNHELAQCESFKAMSPDQRYKLAKQKQLCFRCLCGMKHDWRSCAKKKVCGLSGCTNRHHRLLHPAVASNEVSLNVAAVPFELSTNFVSAHAKADLPVMYKVALIRIFGKNGKYSDTFAFLDDGSCLTLMERDLFEALELEGSSEDSVQWTKGVSWSEKTIRTDLTVAGVNHRKRHYLKSVYSVEDLGLPSQSVDVGKLKELYPHLRGLPLTSLVEAKPKILIGLDQAKFVMGHGHRHGKEEEPCAVKTLLGWIVYGQSAPSVRIPKISEAAKPTMRLLFHEAIKAEDDLHELVRRHFTTEEFGVTAPKGELVSRDDARALRVMEETLRLDGSRYEIGLLWSSDHVRLPDSYSMALNRLIGLEKSLKKKPELLTWVNNHMSSLLSKGYARIASRQELQKEWPRVWYAPTFIVHNPNKVPPKPRLVVDVAAKVKGVSLNTFLLKGPDNLVPLHAGLFKLRERRVAVNADVKEMFHQIKIREEDQQCQRILWRNADVSADPVVYIFEVMMFGPRCSPACSQFVKNNHANRFQSECPEAVDGLTKRTYVDDYFNSHDTLEEAVKVTRDAIQICKTMGFSLVGVQSNSREFLAKMPESHVNPKLVSIDPSESEFFVTKVLGMFWHPRMDHFTYQVLDDEMFDKMELPDFKVSKREILRAVMRIFDPLGLISIYVIRGRIVLQEVWREGFDWDEPVSKDLRDKWISFVTDLRSIDRLRIPRRYVSWNPDDSNNKLLIFVDASEKAFAAAAYLRFEREGQVEVALVMAKAKVAPVKRLSVPRLELQVAVLGVRLLTTIRSSHTVPIHEVIFLSDSKTVLAWINSTKFKFPSFVATRVGEILDSSSPRQWFYVGTVDNVADDGTRWTDEMIGDQEARWFKGPAFLLKAVEEWPITPGSADEALELVEDGIRILVHERSKGVSFSVFEELRPRFRGRWTSAVRVMGFILRFMDICQRKEVERTTFVTPREFDRAEAWLFRKIQHDAFREEVIGLQSKREVSKASSIFVFSPFMDAEGTIRMSSRAQKAVVSYAARNPAILPKNHYLVDVFIQHHHDRNFHVGTALTISDIRERAWIISIRGAVARVKSRCNMCKRMNAKPVTPLMGQLPRARLAFGDRPFTYVGVDCFGPMLVKFGRGTVKRYGMIFTCLTFRAVQIELLNDLSLDQCTMGLRRFLVNRVVTKFLYSDNGLNFVGSKNLLDRDIKEMEAALSEYSARYEGILWRFIPAYSPWMGGAWERLIQSIKGSINFILRGVVPREDVLRNALIEAQGQINRRPLTHIPVDPEDPAPLTPNSMLFGDGDRDVTAPGLFSERDAFSRLYSRRAQHLMAQFTRRWYAEYLPEITRRSKWHKKTKPVAVDDIVILIEPNEIRSAWQLGRISKIYPASDGIVRTADVRLPSGVTKLKRAVGRLAVLDLESSK